MNLEKAGKICYESNRAFTEELYNIILPSWTEIPEDEKEEVFTEIQYYLDNPNATDSEYHNLWLKAKLLDGWKFSLITNKETKESDFIRIHNELTKYQKIKDRLCKNIINMLKPLMEIPKVPRPPKIKGKKGMKVKPKTLKKYTPRPEYSNQKTFKRSTHEKTSTPTN